MKTLSRSVFTIFVVVLFIFLGGTSQMSAQWKKVANLPAPYDQGYYLDVYFLPSNPLYGWVCGFDGYMLRTTDGGLTWQGVTITFFDPQDSRAPMLESVSFVTPLIGYTSGKHGIYKTSDGGVNWTDVTPQNIDRQRLWGCFFLNTNVGLVVGGGCPYFDPVQKVVRRDNQSFYRTTNGGNTWAEFRGGYDNSGMTDAMIYSENGLGYASSSGMIWNTLDGGKTWKEFSPTGTNDWQEEITNIGSSFLVPTAGTSCDGGGNGGSLRFSTDNGLSWKRYSTGESMYGTFLSNSMTGWGVGSNRAVYYTNDGGVSWVNRNCGIEAKDSLDDIYFVTDSIGWAVGNGIYRTYYPKPLALNIDTSGPMFFCEGDSVTLSASQGFENYVWSNGSKDRITTVSTSGKYTVMAFDKDVCVYNYDTVDVVVYPGPKPQILSSNPKYVICYGDTLVLSALLGYPMYSWSNGDTTREIRITKEGFYFLRVVDNNGCVGISDTITIKSIPFIKPIITAKRNFTFCRGDSLILNAPLGFISYLWSNGTTSQTFTTKTGGPFSVIVVDSNGCVGVSDTVNAIELIAKNKLQIMVADGRYEFDSTDLASRNCQKIILYNRDSILPYVLDNPYLLNNILFSIPQNQLPIIIPPLDSIPLNVCFAPFDTSIQRDTLVFEDTCSHQFLPLVSIGKKILVDGDSRCEVPLIGMIYSLGASYKLSAPYPQPSSTITTVTLTVHEPTTLEHSLIPQAILKDIFGNTVPISQIQGESINLLKDSKVTTIEYLFDTHELVTGVYYAYFYLGSDVRVLPILIQR